jgi:hypothetical protein
VQGHSQPFGFRFAKIADLSNGQSFMRSQKHSNKAPRPFKNKSSSRGWSGGNQGGGFIPAPKPIFTKKTAVLPPLPKTEEKNPPPA